MAYHVRETGSARSVGPRRIKKCWVADNGNAYVSRSVAGAKRAAAAVGDTIPNQLPIPAPGLPYGLVNTAGRKLLNLDPPAVTQQASPAPAPADDDAEADVVETVDAKVVEKPKAKPKVKRARKTAKRKGKG